MFFAAYALAILFVLMSLGVWLLQMLILPTVKKVNLRKHMYSPRRLMVYMLVPYLGFVVSYKLAVLEGK